MRQELNLLLSAIQDRLDRIEGIRASFDVERRLRMIEAPIDEARAVFETASDTLDLRESKGNLVDISGPTEISQVLLNDGTERVLRFNNNVKLNHNPARFILPGLTDLSANANDHAILRGYPNNVTRVISFLRGPVGPFGQIQAIYAGSTTSTVLIAAKHKNFLCWLYGGGGGGGGANGVAGESAAGSGGGAGGYVGTLISSSNLGSAGVVADTHSFNITIGGGGAGGVGNAAGAAGGTTEISVTTASGTTTFLRATGGAGGAASGSDVGVGPSAAPGAGGVGSSPSGLSLMTGANGSHGGMAMRLAATRSAGGYGGPSALTSSIAPGQSGTGNGQGGLSNGGGGGGAVSNDGGGSRNGGAGSAGRFILWGFA